MNKLQSSYYERPFDRDIHDNVDVIPISSRNPNGHPTPPQTAMIGPHWYPPWPGTEDLPTNFVDAYDCLEFWNSNAFPLWRISFNCLFYLVKTSLTKIPGVIPSLDQELLNMHFYCKRAQYLLAQGAPNRIWETEKTCTFFGQLLLLEVFLIDL